MYVFSLSLLVRPARGLSIRGHVQTWCFNDVFAPRCLPGRSPRQLSTPASAWSTQQEGASVHICCLNAGPLLEAQSTTKNAEEGWGEGRRLHPFLPPSPPRRRRGSLCPRTPGLPCAGSALGTGTKETRPRPSEEQTSNAEPRARAGEERVTDVWCAGMGQGQVFSGKGSLSSRLSVHWEAGKGLKKAGRSWGR